MTARVRGRLPRPGSQHPARRIAAAALVALGGAGLTGCGLTVPTDPEGTFDRVQGGTLRAGASTEPGLVTDVDGDVTGPLADLVERFAARNDADVRWTVASEESLVTALEDGRLDLAVGGASADTPWADRAGVTRPYTELPGTRGREVVFFVPLGENRMLSQFESFLDEEAG